MATNETYNNSSAKDHHFAVIGMPSWGVDQPFYAVSMVAGIAREAGVSVNAYDINVKFFHKVSDEERETWSGAKSSIWMSETYPQTLWEKYEEWLLESIDGIFKDKKPTLIGFSVNMNTRLFSLCASKYIKSRYPEIPIIFGGVDCFPKEYHMGFFQSDDSHVDIMCTGESEHAFKDFLLEFVETGSIKTKIPGFVYREGSEIVNTGDTDLPKLRKDILPIPAHDLFNLEDYTQKGSLPFYLSRGCIYKCNFCSEAPNFRLFRARNAEEAFRELKYGYELAKQQVKVPTFKLADSNFNANVKELMKFVDLIIQNDLKIKWGGQAHFEKRMTTEVLEKLHRSGLVSIFWGFESASQNVINLMNKKYNQEIARRIIDDCLELGISQVLPILTGYPGETASDAVETVSFIMQYRNNPKVICLSPHLLVIRPNSPLYDNFEKHNLLDNNYTNWSTVDGKNNLYIRITRNFIAQQAQGNLDLTMDRLEPLGEIKNVTLNDHEVAMDLFDVLHELFERTNNLKHFYHIITSWSNNSLHNLTDKKYKLQIPVNVSDARIQYQKKWMEIDKDISTSRSLIYFTILTALKKMTDDDSHVDLEGYYEIPKVEVIKSEPKLIAFLKRRTQFVKLRFPSIYKILKKVYQTII